MEQEQTTTDYTDYADKDYGTTGLRDHGTTDQRAESRHQTSAGGGAAKPPSKAGRARLRRALEWNKNRQPRITRITRIRTTELRDHGPKSREQTSDVSGRRRGVAAVQSRWGETPSSPGMGQNQQPRITRITRISTTGLRDHGPKSRDQRSEVGKDNWRGGGAVQSRWGLLSRL
jgi:hypothetical protein